AGRRGRGGVPPRPIRLPPVPNSMRVLVTGGAGFISSNFIRHLLRATPYEVVSLDALTYAGNLENLADVMSHERLSFVHGDVRDADLVRDVVSEVDVIVNAAAESHVEKSIPRFVTQALSDEPLTIHGDGHASRDWLYVDDDAEAIESIIATPIEDVAGEVLNVATGVDIPVGEIAQLVLALLGKPATLAEHVPERPGQVDRHIGSTEKIRRLCGWSAGAGGGRRWGDRAGRRLARGDRGADLGAARPSARDLARGGRAGDLEAASAPAAC